MRPSPHFTMPFEVERGRATVEYEVEFEIDPEEAPTGPTYDCGGTPGCPASVSSKTVYFVGKKTCPTCLGCGLVKLSVCPTCHGKHRVPFREERPELEDLVDDEELLEYAFEHSDVPDDRPVDAWRDR